jgi:ribosome-associated protein
MLESKILLEKILCAIQRHKALDVEVLEVRDLVDYTDYFLICSGQSDRQVEAIAEEVLSELAKERVFPLGVEGLPEARWVLLDFGDVVVHVFYHPVRAFYDLEGLWRDAPRLPVADERAAVGAAT